MQWQCLLQKRLLACAGLNFDVSADCGDRGPCFSRVSKGRGGHISSKAHTTVARTGDSCLRAHDDSPLLLGAGCESRIGYGCFLLSAPQWAGGGREYADCASQIGGQSLPTVWHQGSIFVMCLDRCKCCEQHCVLLFLHIMFAGLMLPAHRHPSPAYS